jgi:hypothetical protein
VPTSSCGTVNVPSPAVTTDLPFPVLSSVTVTLAPDITPSELATVPTNRPVLVCAKADARLTQNTKNNNIAFFMIYLQLKNLFLNNFANVSSQQSP